MSTAVTPRPAASNKGTRKIRTPVQRAYDNVVDLNLEGLTDLADRLKANAAGKFLAQQIVNSAN